MAGSTDTLTARQVAALLGVTSETVRAWIRTGRLKGGWLYGSRKFGHRIERNELVRFLRENNQEVLAARVEQEQASTTDTND